MMAGTATECPNLIQRVRMMVKRAAAAYVAATVRSLSVIQHAQSS